MIDRTACQCGACRARTDGAFWRLVDRLDIGTDVAAPVVDRIREYGDAPRARTPDEFEAWLSWIIDRAQGRPERDGS